MSQPEWRKNTPVWVQEGREMNEAEWLGEPGIKWMIFHLVRTHTNDRRHLLFGCACCRKIWELFKMDAAKRLVELAEVYADGNVSYEQLRAANDQELFQECLPRLPFDPVPTTHLTACALHAIQGARWLARQDFRWSHGTLGVLCETCKDRARDYIPTRERPWGGKFAAVPDMAQMEARVNLLRDIFGNPFRPVAFDASWRTSTVMALATGIYDDRAFDRLPILADALQDAECDSDDILNHLRQPGEHCRGCWALDLVLGKE